VDPRVSSRRGPVIAVSNHFGGLGDGVLLVDASPRMPRVVARDVIWKVPIIGQIASAAGGIPVHRRADAGTGSNDDMFASCYQALAQGDLILIFPEGVTQDVPHIAPVKTGAARIALGARAAGTRGIQIVPVGVHYEDKAVFRSRVLVNIGAPIDIDSWAADEQVQGGADDHDAVKALTGRIETGLRAAAPDFPDWPTARTYTTAAEVPLHDVGETAAPLRYGDTQLLAKRLQSADGDGEVARSAGRYRESLASARTSDATVARHGARPRPVETQSRWRDLILSLILLPYAAMGVVVGFLPWLLVQAVRLVPAAPAVRATITPGLAALAFGAEWIGTSWLLYRQAGSNAALAALLLFPFFIAATVFVAERSSLFVKRVVANRRPPQDTLAALEEERGALADLVWERL
jgi:glycerol-3-phosphate O-acyltransferase/dihydroxyacetone phosphate acyltransferase